MQTNTDCMLQKCMFILKHENSCMERERERARERERERDQTVYKILPECIKLG